MKKKTPKKPKPKPKPKAKPKARPRPKGKSKNISKGSKYVTIAKSPFLVALRSELFDLNGNSNGKWPANASELATANADLQMALKLMFDVANNNLTSPSPTPATPEGIVIKLMAQVPWPGTNDIPAPWNVNAAGQRAYRFWEVAWAMNYFLEAYAKSGGGGGGPKGWPPPPPT